MSAAVAIAREYRELVPRILADDPRSAKELARDMRERSDVNPAPRTIDNARAGDNGLSVPHFMAAALVIPELKALIRRWLELEASVDPEAEQAALEILKQAQALIGRRQQQLTQRLSDGGNAD
jgi:hypothetical protein